MVLHVYVHNIIYVYVEACCVYFVCMTSDSVERSEESKKSSPSIFQQYSTGGERKSIPTHLDTDIGIIIRRYKTYHLNQVLCLLCPEPFEKRSEDSPSLPTYQKYSTIGYRGEWKSLSSYADGTV